VADTEHVVDDLEALILGGVVDGCDVRDLGVFGSCVVLEEGEGRDDARRRNVDGQLILPYREPGVALDGARVGDGLEDALLDVFGQTRHEVLSVFVQRLALLLEVVGRVHNGALELESLVARSILQMALAPQSLI
jgi:hypothetical protein